MLSMFAQAGGPSPGPRPHVSPWGRPAPRASGLATTECFPFDLEQFRLGMDVELEHRARDPVTNVTDDDVITAAKIARAHLNEFPDY